MKDLSFTGYVIEVGDFSVLDRSRMGATNRERGVLIEMKGRDIYIGGLTVTECKALATRLREGIELKISPAGGASVERT